jgi:hypothetical protein
MTALKGRKPGPFRVGLALLPLLFDVAPDDVQWSTTT